MYSQWWASRKFFWTMQKNEGFMNTKHFRKTRRFYYFLLSNADWEVWLPCTNTLKRETNKPLWSCAAIHPWKSQINCKFFILATIHFFHSTPLAFFFTILHGSIKRYRNHLSMLLLPHIFWIHIHLPRSSYVFLFYLVIFFSLPLPFPSCSLKGASSCIW